MYQTLWPSYGLKYEVATKLVWAHYYIVSLQVIMNNLSYLLKRTHRMAEDHKS